MLPYESAILGGVGAVVPDLLKFINGRFGEPPDWMKRRYYWIAATLLVGLGAIVAYFSKPVRPIDALALGYAAPAIVASLLGRSDGGPPEVKTKISPGLVIEDVNHPLPVAKFPIPKLIRGVRAAWARR